MSNSKGRTKVKMCGITNLEDARFVSGALAHYLGFIFYEKSPRFLDPSKAGAITNWIEGPECMGVFVNQPLDDVNMISRQTGIDFVQLHGNETPEYCKLIDKPVVKAIHVEADDTPSKLGLRVKPYLNAVDYLLFDTKTDGLWGGTGKAFDWSLLEDITDNLPFFLSGGLKPKNIKQACQTVEPYAVDISSGIEAEPGKKDFDKVEALMNEMRDIWQRQE